MSNRFRISGLLSQKLVELSISPEAVLRHADLPLAFFDQEKIYVTTKELFSLWMSIDELSNDPAIGLKMGSEDRIERYDPIAIASLYTRSFRDAMGRAARYKQLTCPEKIELKTKGEECAIQFIWTLTDDKEPPVFTDLCFAWVQSIGQRGIGHKITPLRVEYERPPANRELLEDHFGCPVIFNAKRNSIIFSESDFDHPFLTHNADLLAAISPHLEEELANQRASQNLHDQVKTIIKRVLAGQRPEIKQIAKEIGQSVRTLQRRLSESGISYKEVLEDARRELARHYLLHSSLELNETAYLLGYEDPNSFFRAFNQWEGLPPGRWREQQLQKSG